MDATPGMNTGVRPARKLARTLLIALASVLGAGVLGYCGLYALALGAYRFFPPRPVVYDAALGDLDGDGDLDAFYVNGESESPHANSVLINRGGGVFAGSGQALGGNMLSRSVRLADLDNDGDLDALVANILYLDIYTNNGGAGDFRMNRRTVPGNGAVDIGSGTWAVALGDMDGDGDIDALGGGCCGTIAQEAGPGGDVIRHYPPYSKVWINQSGVEGAYGGILRDSGARLESLGAYGAALGDLDGDGDLDAFFGNDRQAQEDPEPSEAQPNTVWWNDGRGSFSDSGQRLGSAETLAVALGDLDSDGDLDAYSANHGPDEVWLNDGSGLFADSRQRLGDDNSRAVELADLDGDGDLDAAVTMRAGSGGRSRLQLWQNDGRGNFSESGQIGAGKSQAYALGDLDGDGDPDVLAAWYEDQYEVWWNEGGAFRR